MSAIDLSNQVGLAACYLLTLNLLLGVLLGVRYNPWTHWPHRRVNYFRVHNWTGYCALAASALHPVVVLFSGEVHFRILDITVPLWSPEQPVVNTLGAIGLYATALVVATSYWRSRMTRRAWKRLHYTAYAAAILFYVHGLRSDPTVNHRAVDWLDAEKVSVEACVLLVAAAAGWRLRTALAHRRATVQRAVREPVVSPS